METPPPLPPTPTLPTPPPCPRPSPFLPDYIDPRTVGMVRKKVVLVFWMVLLLVLLSPLLPTSTTGMDFLFFCVRVCVCCQPLRIFHFRRLFFFFFGLRYG